MHGRWVADVFNFLSNKIRWGIFIVMNADELFDELNTDHLDLNKNNYDHYNLNFLHFVKNLIMRSKICCI